MDEELIKQCRYYKGEEENPYEAKAGDNSRILWSCERSWYIDMQQQGEAAFSREVEEYNAYKVGERLSSDLPVTLLARIFNRFAQGDYSLARAAYEFPAFYRLWYGEPFGA